MYFSSSETQSQMDPHDPETLKLEYTRSMMGFLLFRTAPKSIAMIGLGGGSLAKFCYRHLPQTSIRVIEINPHVIALREEFLVPPDCERFEVVEGDGADFVRDCSQRFDVLLVDGYDESGLPSRLCSQDFYDNCLRLLTPAGMLVVNLHCGHPQYARYVQRIRRSFGDAISIVDDSEQANSIVFAERGGLPASVRIGPLRRPRALNEAAWRSLQGGFARILSAIARQRA